MYLELWWKDLSTSWKNIFKSELDIDRSPNYSELELLVDFKRIDCSDSAITSIEPLSVLKNLRILICRNTKIKHLDKLIGHSNLEELDCSKTKIYSLLPLSALKNLRKLDCSYTSIQSLDGLQESESLEDVLCTSTEVSSIEPLRHSTKLKYLNIVRTNVSDIEPVISLLDLEQLKLLADSSPAHRHLFAYLESKDNGKGKVLDIGNRDELFEECARLIVQSQSGSSSNLQRRLNLGYNRAGRIIDQIEAAGIVGPAVGSKPREVYVKTEAELETYL